MAAAADCSANPRTFLDLGEVAVAVELDEIWDRNHKPVAVVAVDDDVAHNWLVKDGTCCSDDVH